MIPEPASYTTVPVEQYGSGDPPVVAAVDWDDAGGRVAGFLVSLAPAGAGTLEGRASALLDGIAASGAFISTRVVRPGRSTQSHDDFPMMAGALVDLTPASSVSLSQARNRLVLAVTGLDVSQLPALPQQPAESSDAFRLLLSVLRRSNGRLVLMGAVVTLDGYTNRLGLSRARARDLVTGSLLGRASATTEAHCEALPFAAAGRLDMVWVVDGTEDSTMGPARIKLLGAASGLYEQARHYGVDLRVAVTDMDPASDARFCLPMPDSQCPKTATGPFFTANDAELGCFLQCLLWPSGTDPAAPDGAKKVPASSARRGLASARAGLLSLLPRKSDEPHKLRPETQVALVLASDEMDADVRHLIGEAPLGPAERAKVVEAISPLEQLLSPWQPGELSGTAALALVVDPLLDSSCVGWRGTGYIELVSALGGAHDDLCQQDEAAMEQLLRAKIDALAPRASLLAPSQPPAAGTLRVRLNGAPLFRSLTRGFDYDAPLNSILLHDLAEQLQDVGNQLQLSYIGWQ